VGEQAASAVGEQAAAAVGEQVAAAGEQTAAVVMGQAAGEQTAAAMGQAAGEQTAAMAAVWNPRGREGGEGKNGVGLGLRGWVWASGGATVQVRALAIFPFYTPKVTPTSL
jgi:hypothetical protein